MHTLKEELLSISIQLVRTGLNRGASGNVSVRSENGFIITPSGLKPEDMQSQDMIFLDSEGVNQSAGTPSSEWRFHKDIYNQRPEVGAIIHTHSTFCTTLACLRKDIPPFHYMIALAGGDSIRCAPYALFGSQELSDSALKALEGRKACLLANHGMIVIGNNLQSAMDLALEVESLCEQYWRVLQVASPFILNSREMSEVLERFKTYGNRGGK